MQEALPKGVSISLDSDQLARAIFSAPIRAGAFAVIENQSNSEILVGKEVKLLCAKLLHAKHPEKLLPTDRARVSGGPRSEYFLLPARSGKHPENSEKLALTFGESFQESVAILLKSDIPANTNLKLDFEVEIYDTERGLRRVLKFSSLIPVLPR